MLAKWPDGGAPAQASRVERRASVVPARLRVSLDALNQAGANPSDLSRNPFRFGAAAVSLSASSHVDPRDAFEPTRRAPLPEPLVPAGPVMPWKLTATVQRGSTRWAVFSDCRGIPMTVMQGSSLAGEWTVTAIGLESATLRSLDGRMTTVPLAGCGAR